jgi:hypothetical protein
MPSGIASAIELIVFSLRVGEDYDTACSSRFSRFAVNDDANMRICLESFEATPSKLTEFHPYR